MRNFKYRAFISYSHADEKWARWLHRSLETYRIPSRLVGQKTEFGPVPAKLAPVFRDREELASATDLGEKLTAALEDSAALIVICSRGSARSHWVNEEILAYKRLGRANRVFSLIVDGEPYASNMSGMEEQECFPTALRFQLDEHGELTTTQAEPIAADARPGKDGKSHAKIKLIAGMLGVGFDDLRQRELQRRNRRLAFISVSALAGMVAAIGLATTAVIARNEAEEQRLRAETEAETARRTASFMIDLFAVSDPSEARGRSITAKEILNKGADRISTELTDQPTIQASLMDTIGKVYTNLGLYGDARDLLDKALKLRRTLTYVDQGEVAKSIYNLANVVTEEADYARAEALYREALAILESSEGNYAELHVEVTAALAELFFRMGEYFRAEPLLQQVYDERTALVGHEHPDVADAIEEIGLNQFDQGNFSSAEARLREALEMRWKTLGHAPHPDIAENINNLALVLAFSGRREEAEPFYKQAMEMNRKLYGDVHPSIATSLNNLADNYRALNKLSLAKSMYQDALKLQRKLLGDRHPTVAMVMINLALVYKDEGDLETSTAITQDSLAIQRENLGERHPNVATGMALLGRLQSEQGHLAEGIKLLRDAMEMQEELLGENHPECALTRMDLAETLLRAGDIGEALEQARKAEADLGNSLPDGHWLHAVARNVYGATIQANGDFPEAEQLILSSYQQLKSDPGAKAEEVDKALTRVIDLYEDWGNAAKVEEYRNIKDRLAEAG